MTPNTFATKPTLPRTAAGATVLGLVAVLAGFPVAPLQADTACEDLSGVYEVVVDLPGGGPTDIELDLEQDGCDLTGFVGARTRTAIQNGVVEDATASFTFEAQNQGSGGTLVIGWEITVVGDEVTGTFSHDLFGNLEVIGTRVEG